MSLSLLLNLFRVSHAASELCRFYVLPFTVYLCNVTLLLDMTGEITKVDIRSMDSPEDLSVLTIT